MLKCWAVRTQKVSQKFDKITKIHVVYQIKVICNHNLYVVLAIENCSTRDVKRYQKFAKIVKFAESQTKGNFYSISNLVFAISIF